MAYDSNQGNVTLRCAMGQGQCPGNIHYGTRSSNGWLLGEGHIDAGRQRDMPAGQRDR